MEVADVVDAFDRAAERLRFPEPEHPHSYLVAARLHAFSDAERWALVVDTVGYNPRAANVVDVLHALGNCLVGTNETWTKRFVNRIDNFAEVFEDEPGAAWYRQVSLVIRGQSVPVAAAATTSPQNLFRLLTPQHRDLLLAEDPEVRQLVPADLPQVLRLDDWHHTALRVQPPSPERERRRQVHEILTRHTPPQERVPFEVRPSDIGTYQQIAQVLATADPSHYRPTLPGNTHWSNWPMSGAL
ncbi:hypothetical protein C7C45_03630 [Micromonospora arborensis]|uniref:Uncharacterized protein n=1 Tax=Micromonospora arborensis TaxID=2116518 RepID=A0A318NPT7_9ACTN|nr:hypothetical protein C7C45_03630 [Micromonospora arborensis]